MFLSRSPIEGEWGACRYTIDRRSGRLTISGGEGTDSGALALRSAQPIWKTDEKVAALIRSVSMGFDGVVRLPKDCTELFARLPNLEEVSMGEIDASYTIRTDGMFDGCAALKDVSMRDIAFDSLRSARLMFRSSDRLESLSFPGCTFPALEDADRFAAGCPNLLDIDLSGMSRLTPYDVMRALPQYMNMRYIAFPPFASDKEIDNHFTPTICDCSLRDEKVCTLDVTGMAKEAAGKIIAYLTRRVVVDRALAPFPHIEDFGRARIDGKPGRFWKDGELGVLIFIGLAEDRGYTLYVEHNGEIRRDENILLSHCLIEAQAWLYDVYSGLESSEVPGGRISTAWAEAYDRL